MWTAADHRFLVKMLLCLAALLVLWLVHKQARGELAERWRRTVALVLGALALVSVAAYFEFGWLRYDRYMNPHDVFHYYLGAKYSQETNYTFFYRCALIADAELDKRYSEKNIRNLDNARMESAARVLRHPEACKDRFTEARWSEFKKDIAYFQTQMPRQKWNRVLRDKGYNATPVWNATARLFTHAAPTDSVWGMRMLTWLDLGFMVVAFAALFATFGWRVGLITLIYWGLTYYMSHVHIKGAFMRLDWVAAMLLTVCALQRRRYGLGGALFAWAALARVFPVVFVAGPGFKLLLDAWAVWRTRQTTGKLDLSLLHRGRLWFFASFAATCALLVAWSIAADGGVQLWRSFLDKIGLHDRDISTTRVGFKYLFLLFTDQKAEWFERLQWLWWPLVVVIVVLTARQLARLRDHEALAFGLVPMFFVVAPTFYYYVVLVVPVLVLAARVDDERSWHALAGAFGMSIVLYGVHRTIGEQPSVFVVASFLCLGFAALLVRAAHGAVPEPDVPTPPAATSGGGPIDGGPTDGAPIGAALPRVRRLWAVVAGLLVLALGGGVTWLMGDHGGSGVTDEERERLEPLPPLADDERVLMLAGDVMLARGVERSIRDKHRDWSFLFDEVRPLLVDADFAFANLENPISGRGEKVEKLHVFNASPETVPALKGSGFDAFSLANNHTLDYGPLALDDTIANLDAGGVPWLGIAENNDAQRPFIMDARGVRIGVLAYCDPESDYGCAKEFAGFPVGPARATDEAIERDLPALRAQVDVLVVSMHWGKEYRVPHNERQAQLGRKLVDLGADIVAGGHPHVQQDAELYRGKLIIYSMGNFVFDQSQRPATKESRLYRVVVDKHGTITSAAYLPLAIRDGDWRPSRKPEAPSFLVVAP